MLPNIEALRMILDRRLTVAVDELFGVVETKIAEYQQEMCRSKEDNNRMKVEYQENLKRVKEENTRLKMLLDVVLQPKLKLQRLEELQQFTLSVSEVVSPEKQQVWSSSPGQEDEESEPSQIKKEQEELLVISQRREQLHVVDYNTDDSADSNNFLSTARGKCDYNQNPTHQSPSHLYRNSTQCKENPSRDDLPSITTKPELINTEISSNSQHIGSVNLDWSELSESGESLDRTESDGPPLKLRRRQTKAGQSTHFFPEVRKGTEMLHQKSLRHSNVRCRICARPFITMVSLVIHAHKHTHLLRCGICGRSFESVESLKNHLHFHVARTGLLSCYICGVWFVEDEGTLLEEHIMKDHKLKSYQCLGCNKCFDTRHDLTLHMRSHTKTLAQD